MIIPILTYHNLYKEKESNKYFIGEKDFFCQLEFLYSNGYQCILVDDYYQSLVYPLIKLPKKSIIITFDDGYESNFKIAFPLLKKFNFNATFFITTDWIGNPGYMNPEQLRILKEEGMSIQSHAKTHLFLNEMPKIKIYDELNESKKKIEKILGEEISFVSFPGGRYDKSVIECAKGLNYSAVFCSIPFYLRELDGVHLIGRSVVKYTQGRTNFGKIINLNGFNKLSAKAGYYGKFFLRKLIGNKSYRYIWKQYIERQAGFLF